MSDHEANIYSQTYGMKVDICCVTGIISQTLEENGTESTIIS